MVGSGGECLAQTDWEGGRNKEGGEGTQERERERERESQKGIKKQMKELLLNPPVQYFNIIYKIKNI